MCMMRVDNCRALSLGRSCFGMLSYGACFDVKTTFFGGGDGGDSNPSSPPSLASTVVIVVFLAEFHKKNGNCFELFDRKF